MLLDGFREQYEAECTRACALKRSRELPNRVLWDTYSELLEWKAGGFESLLMEVMKDMSSESLRTFIAFSSARDAELEDARERLANEQRKKRDA